MKEEIVIIGFGQCGGNFAETFQNIGYTSAAINTSNIDLDANKCRLKYHISGAFGCHRNMNQAVEFAKKDWNNICNFIDRNFPRKKYVFFAYGAGGGTGAGLVPIMLDIMSQKNTNKKYGAFIVMPSYNEPTKQAFENAKITYKQLTNVKNGKCIFVLDNNKVDNKFELNNLFAHKFDKVMNMTNPDSRGVIDESEIADVFDTKGSAIIEEWDILPNNTFKFVSHLFADYISGCQKVAINTIKEINIKELAYKIGYPENPYIGYNNQTNLFFATGVKYQEDIIHKYDEIIKNWNYKNEVEGLNYEINSKQNNNDDIQINDIKLNFDDEFFNKYMS